MADSINRRRFLRGTVVAGAAGLVGLEERLLGRALAAGAPATAPPLVEGPMPMGRLGAYTISRVVSGGNLIGGWAHARDLLYVSDLMRAYNTPERRLETFALLERGGVNTVQVDFTQIDAVQQYNRERGGHLQIIASVRPLWGLWDRPNFDELKKNFDLALEQGAHLLYVHGGYADKLVEAALTHGRRENLDYIGQLLEHLRSLGLPAGLGSHALEVPVECDRAGIEADFYFKTHHHDRYWSASPAEARKPFTVDNARDLAHDSVHDNIFDLDPAATARYMGGKDKPWFAFKTMAAGAIPPAEGFRFAFENGADFIVVGMFDFQVAENLRLAREVLGDLKDRRRAWCA